ncbi:hypothetical protein C4901_06115 [Acidiferrobacter sp. SPIII_3]|nr:hypothetical protein C4901_06115 [Acidiferrobacter sp. SPIII_3]
MARDPSRTTGHRGPVPRQLGATDRNAARFASIRDPLDGPPGTRIFCHPRHPPHAIDGAAVLAHKPARY